MADEFLHAPASYVDDIPCFLPLPPDKYNDGPDLEVYLARYRERLERKQICQTLLLSKLPAGSCVLSAAEGTGEIVLSLAKKYSDMRFYAFDITVNRVRIARRLADRVGVRNVKFYIGSVEDIPFPAKFFRGVIERGIFHTLPLDVKKRNLAEIERTCRGTVVMNWMTRNATWYIARQWFRSLLFRDRKIWADSIATYRNIPKECNTLKKLARLVEAETGHSVRLLRSFAGDRELEEEGSGFLAYLEPLGGLVYATDD